MSKKDFFRIILKLFGLYALILTCFQFAPTLLNYYFQGFDVWALITILEILIVGAGTFLTLIKMRIG